ncbi:hypothetical protein M514_09051 [Trichuris suis]|uniref:Uncharacterized protein n=1 Tax=Trichuris suis TaxID=68888 RepID=A0A085LYP5_9BILA|nr:hypothetical protein M513_09051 [Trichuris suis]KFD62571.1 hypothetical protein M514_09051 [Trichuris suis]
MVGVEAYEDCHEHWFSVKQRWQKDLRRHILLSWKYGYTGGEKCNGKFNVRIMRRGCKIAIRLLPKPTISFLKCLGSALHSTRNQIKKFID